MVLIHILINMWFDWVLFISIGLGWILLCYVFSPCYHSMQVWSIFCILKEQFNKKIYFGYFSSGHKIKRKL